MNRSFQCVPLTLTTCREEKLVQRFLNLFFAQRQCLRGNDVSGREIGALLQILSAALDVRYKIAAASLERHIQLSWSDTTIPGDFGNAFKRSTQI